MSGDVEQYTPYLVEQYGIEHTPLMVTPLRNRRNPKSAIAFIGKQMCFFEKSSPQPEIGVPVEVMLTRPMYHRLKPGEPGPEPMTLEDGSLRYGFNWNSLMAVIIEVVDPTKHLLVAIDGFECSGTMCKTTANGRVTDGKSVMTLSDAHPRKGKNESTSDYVERTKGSMWLTPGRSSVVVANNVNAGSTWKVPYKKRIPTNVYVEKSIYEEKSGCGVRVAGLTRPEDCDYFKLFRT